MFQTILVEGLIKAVMDVGLDRALDQKSQGAIDLTPLTTALDELTRQSRDVFSAISHPTQTAGEEMCQRAVTAFAEGWYDDALGDALKSIDLYPYSGEPRLIGGLAALALGRSDKGLELLMSAVKYSANGQPEVGAIAALVASDLAIRVGGFNLAASLLETADEITGGRCPAIVGALWRHGGAVSSSAENRLKQLWWDDRKPPATDYPRSVLEEILQASTAVEPEYLTAGEPFRLYLDDVADLARGNLAAFDDLVVQVRLFRSIRDDHMNARYGAYASVRRAVNKALPKPVLSYESTVLGVLERCKSLPGAAKWPGDVWKDPYLGPRSYDFYPYGHRDLLIYGRWACEQLLEALNQVPALLATALAPADLKAIEAALHSRGSWFTVLSQVRAAADVDVADRAVRAWERYLAVRRDSSPQPVLHLESLGGVLFAAVGGLKPSAVLGPREALDASQAPSRPMVSFTCPGCKFRQQIAPGTKDTTCTHCGKKIRWDRCRQTHKTLPILREWTKWSHPGCRKNHHLLSGEPVPPWGEGTRAADAAPTPSGDQAHRAVT
jgi:hypothetical protein